MKLKVEVGEIWRCSCWENGNFILIYEIEYVVRCTISYHLYNLKNVKNDQWRSVNFSNFNKINTPPWVFFTFFKLYKWHQIAQCITYGQTWKTCPFPLGSMCSKIHKTDINWRRFVVYIYDYIHNTIFCTAFIYNLEQVLVEVAIRSVLWKKLFRKISQEKTFVEASYFNKVAGLTPATLLKRLLRECFPVNFVKFLRTPML